MEVWFTRASVIVAVLLAGSAARADTTVVFGSPAPELRVVDAPPEPAEEEPRSAETLAPAPDSVTPPESVAPAPAAASAEEPRPAASAEPSPRECPRAITIVRRFGSRTERARMPLLDCDGRPRDEARRALSVLARSRAVEEAPTEQQMAEWRERDGDPELLVEGVRLVHPGLLERLQRIGEAFDPHPIEIVSGYRPESPSRSRHHHARALDLVVRGAPREALRDLAVTLPETGVGWYPNSVFVHVDVREESAYWVDLSGPGERPRYVRGAEPPSAAPAGEAFTSEESDAVAAASEPAEGDASEPPLTDEELARMRRETEAALREIVVPRL